MPHPTISPALQEQLGHLKLLVFDLDGVITSESGYWDTARQSVASILFEPIGFGLASSPQEIGKSGAAIISPELIARVKNRAVNSNWDLAFVALCLHLIRCFEGYSGSQTDFLRKALDSSDSVSELSQLLAERQPAYSTVPVASLFDELFPVHSKSSGVEVLGRFQSVVYQRFSASGRLFAYRGALWDLCHEVCQTTEDDRRKQDVNDESVLPVARLAETLDRLTSSGRLALGVATGRPRDEATAPLEQMKLLDKFDATRIVTYDDVAEAESTLSDQSETPVTLGKPHPFPLRKAIEPELSDRHLVETPLNDYSHVAFVGDTASDVLAAKEAGVLSIGVLTGVPGGEEFRQQRKMILTEAGCDLVLNDVCELPDALGC